MNDISKDDILFQPAVSPNNMIYYGWDGDIVSAFKGYIIGYKNAANTIFHRFQECDETENVRELDSLCFPLIFLYRHTVELYLKLTYIVLKTVYNNECEDDNRIETADPIEKGYHKLCDIWKTIKPILSELSKRYGVQFNQDAIEHYMEELDQNDNGSFSFRYPVEKSYDMIHKAEKRIDIENFRNKMTDLFAYFNEILTAFTHADYLKL